MRAETTKWNVIAMHQTFPSWTSAQISRALQCHPAYVRAVGQREHLSFGTSSRKVDAAPPVSEDFEAQQPSDQQARQ